MMNLGVWVLGLSFCLGAYAQNSRDLNLERALSAIDKIQRISKEDESGLNRMMKTWSKHCKPSMPDICFVEECEVEPAHCKADHVLLFRGEDHLFKLPSTSGLLRASLNQSEYAVGLSLSELLKRFSRDIRPLRDYQYGPQVDPVVLRVDSKTGAREWFWQDSRQAIGNGAYPGGPQTIPVTAYNFHVEASFPFYQDEHQAKDVGIDPLISYTSNPMVARSFSLGAVGGEMGQPKGRVVVLSVPRNSLRPLCDPKTKLTPGSILDPRDCKDPLNEYADEQELDVVLYPQPEWVYRAFLIY